MSGSSVQSALLQSGLLQFSERPPAQLEHELCVELLPGEHWLRFEARRHVNLIDLFALTIELATQERDDVQPIPEMRPDSGFVQAEFLDELTAERLMMTFADIESAAGQRPASARRKFETNEQHARFAIDDQPTNCLADTKRPDLVGLCHPNDAVAIPELL